MVRGGWQTVRDGWQTDRETDRDDWQTVRDGWQTVRDGWQTVRDWHTGGLRTGDWRTGDWHTGEVRNSVQGVGRTRSRVVARRSGRRVDGACRLEALETGR